MNIAVFQADHPLQVHTINVIAGLEAAGYHVDLYLYNSRDEYQGTKAVKRVYDFSGVQRYWSANETVGGKFLEAFRWFVLAPLVGKAALLPPTVFQASVREALGKDYGCLIGVEKQGFVWASCVAEITGAPVIYYSLELYPSQKAFWLPWDRFTMLKAFRFLKLRQLEKIHHKRAAATIIQDPPRAKELMRMNNVSKMENLFLPVTLKGPPVTCRSAFLRKRFNIQDNKKIILQFGMLARARSVQEVALAAQAFPEEWVLIFHGPVYDERLTRDIVEIDRQKRIIVSNKMLEPNELDELICSADVGLCFYGRKRKNDYLAGYSSEKLVRYLRCGIPVIAYNYPTFMDSVEKNGCGVCIPDLSSLNRAIRSILDDYGSYCEHAYRAFKEHFEFSSRFENVISFFSEFPGEPSSARDGFSGP